MESRAQATLADGVDQVNDVGALPADSARAVVVVANERGLHARPCSKITETTRRFAASLHLIRRDASGAIVRRADARRAMELLLLNGTKGTPIELVAEGSDAGALVDEMVRLFAARFDLEEDEG